MLSELSSGSPGPAVIGKSRRQFDEPPGVFQLGREQGVVEDTASESRRSRVKGKSETEREKTREHITKLAVDYIFYSPLRLEQPGFRALASIDMFDEDDVGKRLLPNKTYPSDHIAIVGDFQLLW